MRRIMTACLLIAACTGPTVTGNSEGGVMDWFATNESEVFAIAQGHCARYSKVAKITQIVPRAGGSVVFECVRPS